MGLLHLHKHSHLLLTKDINSANDVLRHKHDIGADNLMADYVSSMDFAQHLMKIFFDKIDTKVNVEDNLNKELIFYY